MNITHHGPSRHQRNLEKAAHWYEMEGYTVTIHPGKDKLPADFNGFTPDLLATRDDRFVAVEVKKIGKFKPVGDWKHIKEVVDRLPNWRFDLVLPGEEDTELLTEAPPPDTATYLLNDADALLKQQHNNAALLVAWSALEVLLRSIAVERNLRVEALSLSSLLTAVYAEGDIDPHDHIGLRKALELRNEVMHGQTVTPVDAENVHVVTSVAWELLDDMNQSQQN